MFRFLLREQEHSFFQLLKLRFGQTYVALRIDMAFIGLLQLMSGRVKLASIALRLFKGFFVFLFQRSQCCFRRRKRLLGLL